MTSLIPSRDLSLRPRLTIQPKMVSILASTLEPGDWFVSRTPAASIVGFCAQQNNGEKVLLNPAGLIQIPEQAVLRLNEPKIELELSPVDLHPANVEDLRTGALFLRDDTLILYFDRELGEGGAGVILKTGKIERRPDLTSATCFTAWTLSAGDFFVCEFGPAAASNDQGGLPLAN